MLNTFLEGLRDLLLFPKDPLLLKSALSQVMSVKQDVTSLWFWPLAVTLLDCSEADWIPTKVLLLDHAVFSPGRARPVAAVAVGCYPVTMNPTACLVEEKWWFKDAFSIHIDRWGTEYQTTSKGRLSMWFYNHSYGHIAVVIFQVMVSFSVQMAMPFHCRYRKHTVVSEL